MISCQQLVQLVTVQDSPIFTVAPLHRRDELSRIFCLCVPGQNETLRWFHKASWILQTVALDISICITAVYYALLVGPQSASAVSINTHAISLLSLLIDFFIVDVPVRLLHVVHSLSFGLIYTLFLLVLHGTGLDSRVYKFTDWQNRPGLAAGLCLGLTFVSTVVHSMVFGLYQLRLCLARRLGLSREHCPTVDSHWSPAHEEDEIDSFVTADEFPQPFHKN